MTWINYLQDEIKTDQSKRHACSWIFDSININEDGAFRIASTTGRQARPR